MNFNSSYYIKDEPEKRKLKASDLYLHFQNKCSVNNYILFNIFTSEWEKRKSPSM